MSYLSEHYAGKECPGDGCICCAGGNDLPDGEYCRACLRGADKIFMSLKGAELDAFLKEIGMNPDELLAQFNRVVSSSSGSDK